MKATRDFACVHAFYQRRQAAEIAHAAACKLQVMYTSVLDRKLDITRTCAVRCVCIFLFHCIVAFVYISKKIAPRNTGSSRNTPIERTASAEARRGTSANKKVADVGGMCGVGDHTEGVSRHVSSWG